MEGAFSRKTLAYAESGETAKINIVPPVSAEHIAARAGTPLKKQPALKQAGDMSQDTFTLNEGIAVLQWPSQLSAESVQDIEDWLTLALRKIKRSVPSLPAVQPIQNDKTSNE